MAGQSGAEIKPLKGVEQIRQGARTIVEFTKAGKPKRLVQRCEKCDDYDFKIDFCSFGGFHLSRPDITTCDEWIMHRRKVE